MPKPKFIIDKETLENLYLIEQKNPYEIAEILKCNHKTIRKNLKEFHIPLRTISEYNALANKTYTEPDDSLLFSKSSLILHSIYKCEGVTSEKSLSLRFQNQDPNLILGFYKGMIEIYKYESEMTISFLYNFDCENSVKVVELYNIIFTDYKVRHAHTPTNKNPIITLSAGGRYLYRLFMENCNKIFNSISYDI